MATTHRPVRGPAVAVVVAVAVATWAMAAVLTPRPAVAQEEGVVERAETTWIVDPDQGRATVSIAFTITNTTPVANGVQTWWDGWGVALPSRPDAVTVSTGGRVVDHRSITLDDGTPGVEWDFLQRLQYDETQTWLVETEFRSAPPRSDFRDGPRINPGFVAVDVWAWGADRAELEVRLPARFDGRLGPDAATERDGDVDVWRATVDDGYGQVLVGAADRDDHLAEVVTVDDTEVTVLSWPDDPEWGEQVADFAARALPELAAWTGADWDGDELEIRETAAPFVEGWGGWNDTDANTISVGEDHDEAVWTHELAHNWFGPEEFSESWLMEGLSDFATATLADELAIEDPPEPRPTDQVLVEWGDVVAAAQQDRLADPERWDATLDELYDGAHHVVATVAEEVGPEAFGEMIRMTLAEESSWAGPGDIVMPVSADWREFVTLAERVGGSTRVRDLVLTHVYPGAGPLLERRDAVLADYAVLEDGPWATPLEVRRLLQRWNFPAAEAEIERAITLREELSTAAEQAEDLGVGVPDLQEEWEVGRLDAVAETLDAVSVVLDDIAALRAAAEDADLPSPTLGVDPADDELDVVTNRVDELREALELVEGARADLTDAQESGVAQMGLVGAAPEQFLDEATTALEDGHVGLVQAATDDLDELLDDAPGRGRSRITAVATAAALVLAVLVPWVLRVRRRRRQRT